MAVMEGRWSASWPAAAANPSSASRAYARACARRARMRFCRPSAGASIATVAALAGGLAPWHVSPGTAPSDVAVAIRDAGGQAAM